VLGAREIVQAAVLTVRPGHAWQLGGAVVDALHGASMLALAAASRGTGGWLWAMPGRRVCLR